VLYLTGNDHFVRLRVRQTGGWSAENPNPNVFTHTPGLYLNGDDRYVLLGHDANIHPAYLTRAAGAGAWSDLAAFAPPGNPSSYAYDGSGSARFDPLFEPDCSVVDAVFFDEDSDTRGGFRPDLYYVAIRLAGAASGGAGCRKIIRRSGVAPASLSGVRITRSAFRAGDRSARFRYTLSTRATVTITIQRFVPGHRRGRRCLATARVGRRCTRLVAGGTLRASGRRGVNTTAFAGRVGGRALATGRYRALLVATDITGNHSRTTILAFRIR
jgi:hypothetical protein